MTRPRNSCGESSPPATAMVEMRDIAAATPSLIGVFPAAFCQSITRIAVESARMCHHLIRLMRLNVAICTVVVAVSGLAQPRGDGARTYFTDTILIDQDGVERLFYTDLIHQKSVVIHVMFTDCKDSCPVMARNFVRIQQALGDRV